MIKASHISKSFGTKKILSDIQLDIKPNEITVLFGESGCGKTTLLRILGLLDKPDSGIIDVDADRFFYRKNHREPNKNIYPKLTIVFQQLFLWPHLTNRENILLSSNLKNSDSVDYFDYLVKEFELIGFIDNYPNQSSSGQKQRVAIARALITNPKYLLMDEVTASLDNIQSGKIINVVKKLKTEKNIGVLFITHNVEIAKKIGDKFAFMHKGVIKEYGDLSLFNNPKSEELRRYLKGI